MEYQLIQAVIFDMDGVITDTEPLHMAAERQTCADHGIDAPIELWEHFRGRTTFDIFETIVRQCCPGRYDPAKLTAYKVQTYLQLVPSRLTVFPGVLEFIAACANKYLLALTTSSTAAIQCEVFRQFALNSFFTVVTTGDQVKNGKPHPEPYLLTVRRLGLTADKCAVIEDSDSGLCSAAAAGCVPLGITHLSS
ncbi:HAD family phosphatase [Patescibacteria group bacterium]|nr:HAD family phosphatase [Patescibacteria group bacterium]MBU1916120.1 HAD family phosphatase [Patescibacteria group bacterium]